MIQTNITARLHCTTDELLKLVYEQVNIDYYHNGKLIHGKTGKTVVVHGMPFVYVNKQLDFFVEIIYAGHKLKVLWCKIRPIIGGTK